MAVEDFVQTHRRDVYCLALSILDDAHEAEDATQKSLLAALRGLGTFKDICSLKIGFFSSTLDLIQLKLGYAYL